MSDMTPRQQTNKLRQDVREAQIATDAADAAIAHQSGVYVTRRLLVIAGVIIGLAMALALSAVVAIALWVNSVQNDAIKKNADRIEDIRRLTKPTPAEYREQIRQGFQRCAKEPECRNALRRLLRDERKGDKADASRTDNPDTSTFRSNGTTLGASGGSASSPSRGTKDTSNSTGGGGSDGSKGSGSPSSPSPNQGGPSPEGGGTGTGGGQPPPPEQRPAVDVQVDPVNVPGVCVDGVIGINC